MEINPKIFKAYDIRGLYPEDLNEKNFPLIIKGIYSFFVKEIKKDQLKIVLSRDMRLSSPTLFKIAEKTLLKMGAKIIDIGLASTPTFYFAILKEKVDCGIQISASHNPPQWNGIKFAKRVGNSLVKIGKNTGMTKVKEIVENKDFINYEKKGSLKKIKDIVKDEVDFAFKFVKPKKIKKLKIVADPANAMAILYINELFKKLPCQLIKMNFTLDGRFPAHEPNPLEFKNLKDLQKKVLAEKADLGIAPDGDGDRVFFIDEKGKIISASLISALIASYLLKKNKGDKIGVDVRYTQNIVNAVKKAGGKAIIGPVGHALISDLMLKNDILFTGESSGHFFYRQTGYGESSVITILLILDIITQENKPISEIISSYHSSYESGEINFILPKELKAKKILEKISQKYQDGKISWLDGLSIDYSNWRFNIRTSNTEPLFRLNVESNSPQITEKMVLELKNEILNFDAKVKE
ncbi:MAG: phosphomannomutase/phosphoglucomutase [Patescibacteria group bacterium]|nr:phosphomannomutase/phosphoglucomutase [Patescibacteria group bacterium]